MSALRLGLERPWWRHVPRGVPEAPVSLQGIEQWLDNQDDLSLVWVPEPYRGSARYIWDAEQRHGYILVAAALEGRPRECKWVLAHEAGHPRYGVRSLGVMPYEQTVLSGRQECQATRFATGLLVPRHLVEWPLDVTYVADLCGVEEHVVRKAAHMRAQGY